MKVKELIELLQVEDEDSEVHFAYNYGDHWRTVVTEEVETVASLPVKYSDYHNKTRLAEDGNDEEDSRMVVVLR